MKARLSGWRIIYADEVVKCRTDLDEYIVKEGWFDESEEYPILGGVMPTSFCQATEWECDKCHIVFEFDLWFIVDFSERPDLWEYCRDGSIHTATCPSGHKVYFGAPLLLHNPAQKIVIFSPPPNPITQEQERDMALSLLSTLRRSIPIAASKEPYLSRAKNVPRSDLPREIRHDPIQGLTTPNSDQDEGDLSAIVMKLGRPAGPDDIPDRIRTCEETLRRIDPKTQAEMWGWLQARLGTFLEQNKRGNRTEDIDRAIKARQAALTVYKRSE